MTSDTLFEMNKRWVLSQLERCTAEQKVMFDRMYPKGLTPKNIDWVMTQIENTLRKYNKPVRRPFQEDV